MVSAEKILSFPDPFVEKNVYRYSNNAIPLNPPITIEVTESYIEEMNLKRELLKKHLLAAGCF